jgi:site-specific recombinase XerD
MGKNPLEQIPPPRLPQRVPKHHTLKEIEAMFDSIALLSLTQFEEARNKAIVGVGALAGLRRGELINLKLSDVNMESKQLLVKAETSKSRKERWVPIVHRLDNLLQDYLRLRGQRAEDSCHALWVSSVTGKPLTTHGLAHIVGKVSDDVGFKVKLHSLRHSYGTYSYAGSHDIKAVQENMGHSDLATTMLYVNSLSQDKRDAAEMSPLNKV